MAARSDLVEIAVTGPDRLTYLDSVTTQRLGDAEPGSVKGLLVLDAKGAPLAMAWAVVRDDAVLLLAPPEAADHLVEVVAKQTFLAQAIFIRHERPVTSLAGDDLDSWLEQRGWATASDSWQRIGNTVVVRHPFGAELVGMAIDQLDTADLEVVDLDTLRIASGQPRLGHEVAAGRLPEEYGLLPTHVHLSKGCYPGQEPIAHMWMLGRPRRRLATVTVAVGTPDGDDLTGVAGDRGFAFVSPGATVGTMVSEGVVVTGFVDERRQPSGWTSAQTRRRDRGDRPELLPRRRP